MPSTRSCALLRSLVLTLLAVACLRAQVPITIASNPPGLSFTVDGSGCSPGTYTAPATLTWTGVVCTVTFVSPQSGTTGAQYLFNNWQDGPSSNPRTFVAPAQATTYTANFNTKYLLTVLANPPAGGTVSGGGWYDPGFTATVGATAAIGYRFTGWVGASSSGSVTMNSPQTVTANFVFVPVGNYVVTQIATNALATSINNFGQVVGNTNTSNGSSAFLWTPTAANGQTGSMTILAPSSESVNPYNSATGVSDLGQVVGILAAAQAGGPGFPFLWSPTSTNGTSGSLVPFLGNVESGSPVAINNFGQIAGSFGIWTPSTANGTTGTLNTDGQLNGVVGINDFGQVIMGSAYTDLFTPSVPHGSSGTFTLLLETASLIQPGVGPIAINKNGAILGNSGNCAIGEPCSVDGWLWTPASPNATTGVKTDIPFPAVPSNYGALMSPNALNATGEVIGTFDSSAFFAFLYAGGMFYDLGVLSAQLAGGKPTAINDIGQIVINIAADITNNFTNRVYLLTPPIPIQPPAPVFVSPQSGAGQSQIMTFTFTDPRGWQDLDVENILINNFLDGRNACYLAYSRSAGVLYLVPDAGGGLLPAITLGGSGSTSNSQCSVASTGSSANGGGNTLTLTLNLTFSGSFGGNKVIYMAARDVSANNSGWQPLGVWQVPGSAPTTTTAVVGMTPAWGSGSIGPTTYTFNFSDTKGLQDLGVENVLVNSALDGRHGCYLAYARSINVLYLVNDNGDALLPGQSLNTSGTLSNSQCTVSWGSSAVAASGNNLSLSLNIAFNSGFGPNLIFYLAARDVNEANNTGWQAMGTWTVQ